MAQLGSYDITLRVRRAFRWLPKAADTFGEQALFYGKSIRWMPHALTRYGKETVRLIAEMTLGTGALLLIGGTVGVAAFMTLASGGVIAVQGYSSLGDIGIEALTGFLSAFLNVRIVAPIIAGIALAATIGAGATAQLVRDTVETTGGGLTPASILRIRSDGSRTEEQVYRFDASLNKYVPIPIDLGPETDPVFLTLWGTGIRNRSGLMTTVLTLGSVDATVVFAGRHSYYVASDQINAILPRSLIGRGKVDVTFNVDGLSANKTELTFK